MTNPAANATGHLAAHGMHPCVVTHGATAGTARPAIDSASDAITTVWWVGSVAPTNAVTGDHWTDTANLWLKRYNGTSWDSLPPFVGVKVYRSTAYTLTSGGISVAWDAEDWDTNAFHDTTTNPDRLVIPTGQTGKYTAKAGIRFSATAAQGRFILAILKNGSAIHGGTVERNTTSSDFSGWSISVDVDMTTVGDYLTTQVFLDTTSVGMDLAASGFSMTKIG